MDNMIKVIDAFSVPCVKKLFIEELLYAMGMKYEGREDWFEYLFEAYLDCKQLVCAMS